MKFMVLVKATKDSEAGVMPTDALISEMVGFHEEMAKAGILVDGAGLRRSADGWRIKYSKGGKRSVVDGPFTETKELVAGYTIIDVKSREEALAWTKRLSEPVDRRRRGRDRGSAVLRAGGLRHSPGVDKRTKSDWKKD